MAKLGVNRYYNRKGEAKVNSYLVSIPRKIAEQAGFTEEDRIKVKAENGKIIVEKE